MSDRLKKLRKWQDKLKGMNFFTPPGRGALWTGLGAQEASRISLKQNKYTLEMTADGKSLDKGYLQSELQRDFGPDWNDEKKLVWTWASQKLVSRMSGPVDVYMKAGSTRTMDGMALNDLERIQGKILFDEIMEMEIAGQVIGNGNIESVNIKEFDEKMEMSNSYVMPISKEWN